VRSWLVTAPTARASSRCRRTVRAAILRSHGSIGTSILYTSLTSVVGFAVLVFSEFRPNAYFGVLTGVAMIAALFGMLTLLPVLLTVVSPWSGPPAKPEAGA